MILCDVNVLVYAFMRDQPQHDDYRSWLEHTLTSGVGIALSESTAAGFMRIVTNPRVFADPAAIGDAVGFVDELIESGRASWLSPNAATWAAFRRLAGADRRLRANLVPDAWLAALAIAHGCRLATADRGVARFAGLDWFDPVA